MGTQIVNALNIDHNNINKYYIMSHVIRKYRRFEYFHIFEDLNIGTILMYIKAKNIFFMF